MRPSPLPNRVAPDGSLHAVAGARRAHGQPRRPAAPARTARSARARWRSRAWICCLTEFRGRHRDGLGDGYTELFFLDEATALAAGHRPCFECRRADARAFAAPGAARRPRRRRAAEMDRVLHAERLGPPRARRASATLPGGRDLRRRRRLLPAHRREARAAWSFAGYGPARALRRRRSRSRRSRPRTSARRSRPATGRSSTRARRAQLSAR